MANELTPEQRGRRIDRAVKLLGTILVGLIISPFIFIAFKGLLGLALACFTAMILIQFVPVVSLKIQNAKLKMLKSEAARNPVETLQNDYNHRMTDLAKFRENLSTFSAGVQNYRDNLSGFKKQYPSEAPLLDEQLGKFQKILEIRKEKYQKVGTDLAAYRDAIKMIDAKWKISQEAAQLSTVAGASDDDFLATIMAETAIDSVQKSLNKSFSELELSLLDEERAHSKTLPGVPRTAPVTITVKPLDVGELVRTGGA